MVAHFSTGILAHFSISIYRTERNKMENEEYFCIDCAKQLECWGSDIKLDDPDLCIPINCIDYQDMDELFNS